MSSDDFMWTTGMTLCEMRLIIEGACVLHEEGASALLGLAREQGAHKVAQTLEAVGCALDMLRDDIHVLQEAHTAEVLRQLENGEC